MGCAADTVTHSNNHQGRQPEVINLMCVHIPCGMDITSLCHGMASLLLLHCLLLLMLLVTGNWYDQLMERVMPPCCIGNCKCTVEVL